jgi:hypothetical protein
MTPGKLAVLAVIVLGGVAQALAHVALKNGARGRKIIWIADAGYCIALGAGLYLLIRG